MLVFVDYEHTDGYRRPHGRQLLAARTMLTYRLEDLAGLPCHLVRYDRIDSGLLERLGASAILISGNSVGPDAYTPRSLDAINGILRNSDLPVFGFCGGLQLIGQALGADVVPLPRQPAGSDDPSLLETDDGRPFEFGYHPVDVDPGVADHPLLSGLGGRPVFRHAHGLHLPQAPAGFRNLASTPLTPIQLVVDDERKVVGTQFHPEYWSDEHPAGRELIANFLRWCGLADPGPDAGCEFAMLPAE